MTRSRRRFLSESGRALVGAAVLSRVREAGASPMNEPIGFQAFEIIPDLKKDWDGTWKTMAGIGYKFVDLVTGPPYLTPTRTAKDLRATIEAHGLDCTNAHFSYNSFKSSIAQTMAAAHDLKLKSVVCSPSSRRETADDWKFMADELNTFGAQVKKEGMFIGYHNHEVEFRDLGGGQVGWDILMANTDPSLVQFQIDVGNLSFAGKDATTYLKKYSTRYFSLHAKDLVPGKASVPVGEGKLDWKSIFAAAKNAGIRNYVAEVGAYGASTVDGAPLEPSELTIIESFRRSFGFLNNWQDN